MWLEKAPMVFLIISALVFIIGLNLLAWARPQVRSLYQYFPTTSSQFYLKLRVDLKQSLQSYSLERIFSGCLWSSIGSFWSLNKNTLQQSGFCTLISSSKEIWSYSEIFGGSFLLFKVLRELELTSCARALGNNREVGRLAHEMSPWIDKTRKNPYLVLRPIRYLSLTILLCWSIVRQIPFAIKNTISVFKSIPSAFKNITSAFKSIPSTIRNTPTAFKNILSSFENLLSAFRKFVANLIGSDRAIDPEAAGQGFQAAKEDFVKALVDKFAQTEVLEDMQEALDCWESP